MKRLFGRKQEDEHNFWLSFTDLMTAFLIIFMIFSLVTRNHFIRARSELSKVSQLLVEKNISVDSLMRILDANDRLIDSLRKNDLSNVMNEFKKTILPTDTVNVDFNEKGSIILTHRKAAEGRDLFRKGEPKMTEDLEKFIKANGAKIVRKTIQISKERQRNIELRIEGHTDPCWDKERDTDFSFLKNLNLSSERSLNVYDCILRDTLLTPEEHAFVKKNMISVGYSYANRLISDTIDDSSLDNESRRIEFRIIVK